MIANAQILIFSLQPTGTAHYAIGLIVMLLHIINVRIANE